MKSSLHHPIKEHSDLHKSMQQWRHDLHRHPELSYEEVRSSQQVVDRLQKLGMEIHTGLGITGVVGVLQGRHSGGRHIALRADMDALPIQELNDFAHRSTHEGKMHACGHDGHTAMLLGAATCLAENPEFAGVVYFIFQPAEEGMCEGASGGERMVEEGLFERFPIEEIYGMHNWPALPAGEFAVHAGAVMASSDRFEVEIKGSGGHAAMPTTFNDPVVIAGQIINALQTVISRNLDPTEQGLISIANIHAGDGALNVVPEHVYMNGTIRTLSEDIRHRIRVRMQRVVENTAAAFDATATVRIMDGYPATINSLRQAEICYEVVSALAGQENCHWNPLPSMGAEDFAFMLEKKPGAYIWVGNGQGQGSHGLHNANYDFNDYILPLGASYWVELVRRLCR